MFRSNGFQHICKASASTLGTQCVGSTASTTMSGNQPDGCYSPKCTVSSEKCCHCNDVVNTLSKQVRLFFIILLLRLGLAGLRFSFSARDGVGFHGIKRVAFHKRNPECRYNH